MAELQQLCVDQCLGVIDMIPGKKPVAVGGAYASEGEPPPVFMSVREALERYCPADSILRACHVMFLITPVMIRYSNLNARVRRIRRIILLNLDSNEDGNLDMFAQALARAF